MPMRQNEDDELAQENPFESLQMALETLIPLRRQRFIRAQRVQRQLQNNLIEAESQQHVEEQHLQQAQLHYQRQREGLRKQSCRQTLTAQVNAERTALETMCRQQQSCQQSEQRCQQVAHELTQASQHTRERQKDLEKLEYLAEHLEDA
ncbi:type III secretion system protein [Pantoea stewartii]|uniref:Type III secretion system protein n=3 Tax=Pantoea stewartii subsp. stewartii TaxID=66271 RepID=A0ABN4Z855_PANSE|nr:type III secretion system protein [Pantoea stewartii subsp. stewartii DC283]KHE01082.1 type III secretion system protein [Pantoea stewartii]KHN63377.1 type III secretion system protein [Pantoea stewartii]NRH24885.1 type III secretion system protein [Pantoea stewartii]